MNENNKWKLIKIKKFQIKNKKRNSMKMREINAPNIGGKEKVFLFLLFF